MLYPINEIAVLTSTLLALAVGSIWYSPIMFGNIWARTTDLSPTEPFPPRALVVRLVFLTSLVNLIAIFVLAELVEVARVHNFSMWILASLLLLYVVAQLLHIVIWEQKPLSYVGIHFGYSCIVVYGAMAVIAWWPW